MAIIASDNNLIRNVRYEDIRIEDIQEGQLFNIRVYFNEKYSKAAGRSVQDVVLKNISYTGNGLNPSVIQGHTAERNVQGVLIQNLRINDQVILEPEEEVVRIGQFTKGIKLKK